MTSGYKNLAGEPASLTAVCRESPEWAASRITVLTGERDRAAAAANTAAEECERLRADCAEYEIETMAWQDASGLTGDECKGGDPSDITPEKLAAWDWPGKFDAAAARAEAAEKRADEREAARAELDAMLCKKFAEEIVAKKRIAALEGALGEAIDTLNANPRMQTRLRTRLRAVLRGSGT